MRFVFLDIDGVLATSQTYNAWERIVWEQRNPDIPFPKLIRNRRQFRSVALYSKWSMEHLLDEGCCKRVQRLCEDAQAEIIVSSSWRGFFTLEELASLFRQKGLTTALVGATPDLGHRGDEIRHVVEQMSIHTREFIILEDVESVEPYESRCIRTTFNGNKSGFQNAHLRHALRAFQVDGA
jgi:hypothetical protein